MPDELDPRLEARLRDALHHEADALPFTLTISDLEATRRERRSVRARNTLAFTLRAEDLERARRERGSTRTLLRIPVWLRLAGSLLAAAADPSSSSSSRRRLADDAAGRLETASPDPRAAELESYADLAARLPTEGGQVVLAQGEDLAGAAPGTGPKETVIGTIPANAYVDWVFDCRGNSVSVSLRRGQEADPAARWCAASSRPSSPSLGSTPRPRWW